MIGALVFPGCPWRALLRLSGGDWNAVLGLAGLICGIWIGTLFLKNGYNLGRTQKTHFSAGLLMPLVMLGFLALMFIYPQVAQEPKSGVLFYSVKGPGASHAPLAIALGAGLIIGFLAQRSRFCTMGAFRDLILFKQVHLLSGVIALIVAALVMNLILGQFTMGKEFIVRVDSDASMENVSRAAENKNCTVTVTRQADEYSLTIVRNG